MAQRNQNIFVAATAPFQEKFGKLTSDQIAAFDISLPNGWVQFMDDSNGNPQPFGATNSPSAQNLFNATFGVAAQGSFRVVDSEPVLNYAGSTSIGSGNGSVAGVRGNITVASGTTISGGYVYGTQGKATVVGTLSAGSGVTCGILGQLDTSNATQTTLPSSQLAAIWGDMGATSHFVTAVGANILRLTNTTNTLVNSAIQVVANAVYGFDLSDVNFGGPNWLVGTTASTAAGTIKVLANGSVRYIQLYSGVA